MSGSLRLPEQGGASLNTGSREGGEGSGRGPRQSKGGTTLVELYEALRQYRSSGKAGGLEGQRAHGRLYKVLFTVLYNWARRDRRLHEPEDVAHSILQEIFEKVGQCRALDYIDAGRGIPGAFAWVKLVYQSRCADWLRREKRHAVLPGVAYDTNGTEPSDAGVVEQQAAEQAQRDALAAKRLAADRAREAIRRLIRTEVPPSLLEEAKKLEVGLTLEKLNLQLHVFERVRLQGIPTYDVGVELGQQGGRKTIQDRVSKWVERGKHALWIGARLALEEEEEPAVREELGKLVLSLAKPLRRRKS
jgi:DNA-directed RNA polymerase specialized sigma24 family protein